MMILRCDVRPVEGEWRCPTTNNAAMWESTPMPDFDLDVVVEPRVGNEENVEWRVMISSSDKAIKLSVEDM